MTNDVADKSKKELTDRERLEKFKKLYKRDKKSDVHNRTLAVETLKFLNGEQWDSETRQRRKLKGRPILQINTLGKYSNQVRGEWLKNCVRIKIRPVDSKADIKIAKTREGLINNIEYLSDAESIYGYSIDLLTKCGYAAWRVRSRYTDDNPFLQELYIEKLDNPMSVYWDADSRQENYSDAKRVWISETLSKEEFEEKYPDAKLPGSSISENATGTSEEHWYDPDSVTVAECYYKDESEKKKMAQLSDGQIMEKKEAEEYIKGIKESYEKVKADQERGRAEAAAAGREFSEQPVDDTGIPEIVKEREVEVQKIKWLLMSAEEIIEEKEWRGSFLPIIMVNGEMINIEGKRYIYGMFRDSIDPQKMLNHWHTAASEFIGMAPKAQWVATAAMIDGYEKRYADANEENDPVMLYNVDPVAPGAQPKRLDPPTVPSGILSEISRAEQNIKDCIGMYNVDVGDQGRELSGRAIEARQVPGDTATYLYPKRMAKAIAWTGRILNDLIPYYYDTERDLRLRNVNDTETFAPINTTAGKVMDAIVKDPAKYSDIKKKDLVEKISKEGRNASFNDITVGKYDVVISTGPTFASQRAEGLENITKIAMAPRVSPIDKHLIFKYSDFPGADEAAEIYKKMVPQNLIPPKPGEQPIQPPPPPPQMILAMEKIKLDKEKQKTEQVKLQLAIVKLQNELSQSKEGIDQAVISKMQEAFSEHHPADRPEPNNGLMFE